MRFHDVEDIQRCFLLPIKTGGCSEDCSYCAQSAHHSTGLKRVPLISVDEVRIAALRAREQGAKRICMGAAWRKAPGGEQFERILAMVREVKSLGLEACITLGMLTTEQARSLKEAGLDSYNHNLDTCRSYYSNIVTTHTYDDRLQTIREVRGAGIGVCCGGILGLGESEEDRCNFLSELAQLDPQPESVPINLLVPVKGTPLEEAEPVETTEVIRTIAAARILMPHSRVRLSAGRLSLNKEAQLLAFFAGANSIFIGEKLLTTPNVCPTQDVAMLAQIQA
jgi:biotin synthase